MMLPKDAWQRADDYAARAEEAVDEHSRLLFTRLTESWVRIARNWELLDIASAHAPLLVPQLPEGGEPDVDGSCQVRAGRIAG
jgi:hypothetical protein